jgi:hypothetical protein
MAHRALLTSVSDVAAGYLMTRTQPKEPVMAAFKPRQRPFATRAKGAPKKTTRRRAPPSAALIDLVLECADLRDDLGGGRLLLRLSPDRLADPGLRARAGAEAGRMGDVAVIWDEIDDVIFRVLDGGPPPLALVTPSNDEDDDRFVLTPKALEYIANSQSTRRG